MYDDYLNLLFHIYDMGKRENTISARLLNPTPGNLKEECIIALDRVTKRDMKALRDFFKQDGDNISWERVIKKFDTDKFRPLQSYLLKETNSTGEINVEILAWLLDIQDRPYNSKIDYQYLKSKPEDGKGKKLNEKELEIGISSGADGSKPENSRGDKDGMDKGNKMGDSLADPAVILFQPNKATTEKRNSIPFSGKKLALILLPVLIGVAIFLAMNNKQSPGGCMYWTGDHYEEISCHTRPDTQVVALDSLKLKHFRKIKQPDTISYGSIGMVWYSKISNNYEFFTAGGTHPMVRGKKLRPITPHIIETQIFPLKTGKVFY